MKIFSIKRSGCIHVCIGMHVTFSEKSGQNDKTSNGTVHSGGGGGSSVDMKLMTMMTKLFPVLRQNFREYVGRLKKHRFIWFTDIHC